MAILFKKEDGKKIYKGIVNDKQRKKADLLNEYLEIQIPKLENELSEKYEKISIKFWFYFGNGLREIVKQFDVKNQDRKYLWEAISNLVASEVSIRKNRSSKRMNFEYFYRLSELPLSDVEKLNWSEWCTFFDSISIRREERSFSWFISKLSEQRMNREVVRMLMIAMNKSLEGKETWVYSDEILWDRFNKALEATLFLIQRNKEATVKTKVSKRTLSERQRTLKKKVSLTKTKKKQAFFKKFFQLLDIAKEIDVKTLCEESYDEIYNKI